MAIFEHAAAVALFGAIAYTVSTLILAMVIDDLPAIIRAFRR